MKSLEDLSRTTAAFVPLQKNRAVVRFLRNCIHTGKVDANRYDQFREVFTLSVKQIDRRWKWSNWRICEEIDIESALVEKAWAILTSKDSLLARLIVDVPTWNGFQRNDGSNVGRRIPVNNVLLYIKCMNTMDITETCCKILKMMETPLQGDLSLSHPLEQVMFACILIASMPSATRNDMELKISQYIIPAKLCHSDKFAMSAICKCPFVLDWLWNHGDTKVLTELCDKLAIYLMPKLSLEDEVLINWFSDHIGDVNSKNEDEDTLLHVAAKVGNRPLVEKLLSKGADVHAVNCNGKTPLHKAADGGDAEVVKFLLDNGAEIESASNAGITPLLSAVLSCQIEAVDALLSRGGSVNANSEEGPCFLGQMAIRSSWKIPNLILLLRDKNVDVVRTENQHGETFLHSVAFTGNVEIMKELINMGADVDKQRVKGETPLHFACRHGRFQAAQCLLRFRADATLVNGKQRTALHEAAWNSHHEIVEIILPEISKQCINALDYNGKTALHLAAEFNKDKRVVLALLNNGADAKIESKEGKTAKYFASCNKHTTEILDEFLKL